MLICMRQISIYILHYTADVNYMFKSTLLTFKMLHFNYSNYAFKAFSLQTTNKVTECTDSRNIYFGLFNIMFSVKG